jgi:predicted RNase H-like HicB family nuclease
MKFSIEKKTFIIQEENGGFVAETPEVPGCIGRGASQDEAVADFMETVKARNEGRPGAEPDA